MLMVNNGSKEINFTGHCSIRFHRNVAHGGQQLERATSHLLLRHHLLLEEHGRLRHPPQSGQIFSLNLPTVGYQIMNI